MSMVFGRLYNRWRMNRDKDFLIKEGLVKAQKMGLELRVGEQRLTLEDPDGELVLPSYEEGVDVVKLMSLVANDYPLITERYLDNKKRLGL